MLGHYLSISLGTFQWNVMLLIICENTLLHCHLLWALLHQYSLVTLHLILLFQPKSVSVYPLWNILKLEKFYITKKFTICMNVYRI